MRELIAMYTCWWILILFSLLLQGMRRSEQHSMLEIFRTQMVSNSAGAEITQITTATDSSRIKRLEKLIKKQF